MTGLPVSLTVVTFVVLAAIAAGLAYFHKGVRGSVRAGAYTPIADAIVAVVIVLTTATASLVLEDAFPAQGEAFEGTTWLRGLALIVLVGLLSYAVWLRRRLQQGFGTVYYAQMLSGGMTDRRVKQAQNLGRQFKDVRLFDEPLRADRPRDFVAAVTKLSDQVSDSMQHDSTATGYHLAPNMLWPAAMAFGSQMTYLESLRLIDLKTLHGDGTTSGQDRKRHADKETDEPIAFEWSWRDRWSGDFPLVVIEPLDRHAPGDALVVIDASDEGPVSVPASHATLRRYCVNARNGGGDRPSTVDVDPSRRGAIEADRAIVPPWAVVRQASRAIGLAVHDCREGDVVFVMARMTKTAAVSLGRRLVALQRPVCGISGCFRPGCRNPWSVLVPLNRVFPPTVPESFEPWRVHPDQPAAVTSRTPRTLSPPSTGTSP